MQVSLVDGIAVGAASDGARALQLAEAHRPARVILDLRRPGAGTIHRHRAAAASHAGAGADQLGGPGATIGPALRAGRLAGGTS